jgi:predicted ArsR family transcriptional regulator|nr:ArsR family transcriptional regulator [Acidimicrobiia bacterium]
MVDYFRQIWDKIGKMEPSVALEQSRYRALADPTRRRILRILEDMGEPVTVDQLSSLLGLHSNTVRGHLEALERAALVERSVEKRRTPGRPRLLYSAVDDPGPDGGGYRMLAEMLTTSLKVAADDPAGAAKEAGREWGRRMVPSDGSPALSREQVIERVTQMLANLGFEPQRSDGSGEAVIDLRGCPFRDLARSQPDVVCSLHHGLLEGAVEAMGGAARVESLQPFVAPSLCRTVVR